MKINLRKRIEPMSLKYNLSDLPTGSESRQSHLEFIRVNLELLLAVAWNGYESESLTTVKRIATESGYPNPFQGEEKRQINEYKPEKQVVVCFIRSDGGFSSYVIAHPFLTAKQAYEANKSRLEAEFAVDSPT